MLMNNRNSLAPSIGCALYNGLSPIPSNAATIRLMESSENLDEGALARAVFARERVHPSRMKPEIDVAQNLDRPEVLRNALKFDHWRRQSRPS